MRQVYSTLFAAIQGLDTSYEVPPDFENIRVLRDLDAYWGGGPSGSASVRLIGTAGQTIVEFHATEETPGGAIDSHSWQWRGRQVVPVGGVIFLTVAGPPADVTLSGYTLTP